MHTKHQWNELESKLESHKPTINIFFKEKTNYYHNHKLKVEYNSNSLTRKGSI